MLWRKKAKTVPNLMLSFSQPLKLFSVEVITFVRDLLRLNYKNDSMFFMIIDKKNYEY